MNIKRATPVLCVDRVEPEHVVQDDGGVRWVRDAAGCQPPGGGLAVLDIDDAPPLLE